MTIVDRILRRWRIAQAVPFINPGARVLDIGSGDGLLFEQLGARISAGIGIDSTLSASRQAGTIQLVAGSFPENMPAVAPFDAITALAVVEHFPANQYAALKAGCFAFLKPGGLLIITVPSACVDPILHCLKALHLIHGMSLEEHHGYRVSRTVEIFSKPEFELVVHRRFQLGLNNFFVFRRNSPGAGHVS